MKTRWIAVLVSILGLIAARAEAQSTVTGPIKIAIVGPFSGRSAEAGERVASAVKMAIEEQNAAGGILGAKVEAVIGDDEGLPEKSTLLAQRMVDDPQVLGVIGPMNSGAVLATGGIYERGTLPFITPTATNARLDRAGLEGGPSDSPGGTTARGPPRRSSSPRTSSRRRCC